MNRIALLPIGCLLSCAVWAQNQPQTQIITINEDVEIINGEVDGQNIIIEEIIDLRLGDVEGEEVEIEIEIDEDAPKKAFLGVTIHDDGEGNVEINEVVEGSPAAISGLTEGDIVININGNLMESANDLVESIQSQEGGDVISIVINRNGEEMEVSSTLGTKAVRTTSCTAYSYSYNNSYNHNWNNRTTTTSKEEACEMVTKMEGRPMLGVYVNAHSSQEGGAIVSGVIDGRGAKDAGMAEGDLIVGINRADVTDFENLKTVLGEYKPGDKVRVRFMRDGQKMTEKVVLTSWSEIASSSYNHYVNICDEEVVIEEEIVIEEVVTEEPAPQTDEMESGGQNSVLSLDIELNLELFPNPANEQLQLNFKGQESPFLLSIVGVDGKVVYSEAISEATGVYQTTLDVSTYPAGTYFVNIDQGEVQISEQLILIRE